MYGGGNVQEICPAANVLLQTFSNGDDLLLTVSCHVLVNIPLVLVSAYKPDLKHDTKLVLIMVKAMKYK